MLIKLESTTSFLKRRKSQNSGLRRMLWKKRRRFHRPGRWWQLFFGHGIVFIDYFEKSKTITGMYYASLIDSWRQKLRKNSRREKKRRRKYLFYQNDAPFHILTVIIAKIHELWSNWLTSYLPDLIPRSDFFLFPRLKVWLGGDFHRMSRSLHP